MRPTGRCCSSFDQIAAYQPLRKNMTTSRDAFAGLKRDAGRENGSLTGPPSPARGRGGSLRAPAGDRGNDMNLALWLERAGKSHGAEPAVGLGDRVARDYRELADRVARLAAGLHQRFALQLGDRVAIAAQNSVDYLDVLYAIWHAGLVAVPANAKLHGAELGYILEHSQARACFASPGVDAALAAHAPPTLERLVTIGSPEYAGLFQA